MDATGESANTEYNVWWRTDKSPGHPPSLQIWGWWKNLKFSRLTLEELVRSVRGEEVTHLMFAINKNRNTVVPADLPEEIKSSLKHLIIRGVEDRQVSNIVSCLSNLRSLESLCLYHVKLCSISDEMRDTLIRLKLKHLTLFDCGLSADALISILLISSLGELDLSDNNLSNYKSISDKLSSLTSMRRLDLQHCYLTEIPECISLMTSLEEVDLSRNDLSRDRSISKKLSSLTSLRRLNLRKCDLTEIPESILLISSLEELDLTWNNLSNYKSISEKLSSLTSNTEIPESISLMTSLEELDLSRNNPSRDRSISKKLSSPTSLRRLNLGYCKLTEIPESISLMTSLEKLNLSNNNLSSDKSLSKKLSSLTSLRGLYLRKCDLTEIPESILLISSLEELDLSDNNLSNYKSISDKLSSLTSNTEIPESISLMTSLEELDLSGNNRSRDRSISKKLSSPTSLRRLNLRKCDLTEIPESISLVTSLELLTLSGNNLSSDESISEKLSSLTSMRRLYLWDCKLTEIPESIYLMTSLEELDLSRNNLSSVKSISKKWSSLTSLRRLNLSHCDLTEIPESISLMAYLEELDLSYNNLSSDKSISEKLSALRRRLDLSHCHLTEIPESVQYMSHIKELYVNNNQIELLPEWIGRLSFLEDLDLRRNETLKRLHKSLLSLPLTKLDVHGCTSLSEPPYYVCEDGLENIRQYYTDLGDTGHTITLSTVIVIGRKKAGKSSLIQSLKDKDIVSTNRRDDSAVEATVWSGSPQKEAKREDEATKVFNLLEISVASSDPNQTALTVNAVDFGGDEIYHHAYQLTFRKDCIPMVVVNIMQFLKESQMWARREATRRVVFDWISHLFLACPKLERPILVITHKDEAGQRFIDLKRELMATIRDLHQELLQESSLDKEIEHLQSTGHNGFFKESEIFEVQHDLGYSAVFAILENVIYQRASKSAVTVPLSWKVIMDNIRGIKQPHINISDLRSGSYGSTKQTDAILDFMRRSGEILWYKDDSRLKDIIFHNVRLVKDMIKALFDHASHEHKSVLKRDELGQLWQVNSSAECPPMPTDIAIRLLTKFNLIYGPTTVNHNTDCYLIPYFKKEHQFSLYRADINLEAELGFAGLSIPVYAYQQMTVSFLKITQKSDCHVHAYGNGASARLGEDIGNTFGEGGRHSLGAELIHEPEHQRVLARVRGDVSYVKRCWDLFLNILQDLSRTVKSAWPAACIRYEFACPHCLLLEDLNPERRSSPVSMEKAINSRGRDCRCRNTTNIPSPLRYPCGEMQETDMLLLVHYIRSVHPDEEQEITRIMGESDDVLNNRNPDPQTAIHPRPTAEIVYQMTRTRGRALVINNRYGDIREGGGGRRGSDKDYIIMTSMLESFGFIISHLSQDGNWTSHEIVEAVHNETELVYKYTPVQHTSVHEGLGMFVLVMMSHGDTGTILGCDGKHVNLVDIYKMLSAQYFPAMRGKPKLVILQACSGVRQVVREPSTPAVGDPPVPAGAQNLQIQEQNQAGQPTVAQQATKSPVETNIDNSYQTIDDLLVMKPSFDEHVCYRAGDGSGSFFIRALVAAFYRYAGDKDLRTLSDSIQQVVRKKAGGHGIEQVPVTISTFTNGRKLYLSPGVNMRTTDHPDSFTSRDLPPPERQRISLNWRDDDEVTMKNDPTVKKIVSFEVVRN